MHSQDIYFEHYRSTADTEHQEDLDIEHFQKCTTVYAISKNVAYANSFFTHSDVVLLHVSTKV